MGELVRLKTEIDDVMKSVKDFGSMLESGVMRSGLLVSQNAEGLITYRTFGDVDVSAMIGMIEIVKHELLAYDSSDYEED